MERTKRVGESQHSGFLHLVWFRKRFSFQAKLALALALFFVLLQSVFAAGITVEDGSLNVSSNVWVDTNSFFVNALSDRVGIGTISPTANLDVAGTINTTTLRVAQNATIDRLNVTNDVIIGRRLGINITAFSPNRFIQVNGVSAAIEVDGASNSSPNFILGRDFNGSAAGADAVLGQLLFIGTGSNPSLSSSTADLIGVVDASGGTRYKGRLALRTSDGSNVVERMRIDSLGRIGIATTGANNTLEVNGNISLNNTLYVKEVSRVGIGTSSPTTLLDVSGTINTTTLKVAENASINRLNITGTLQVLGCVSGFTNIGLGCLQTAEEGSSSAGTASENCYDTYRARLPSPQEMSIGINNYALTDETDDDEWIESLRYTSQPECFALQLSSWDSTYTDVVNQSCSTSKAYRCYMPHGTR